LAAAAVAIGILALLTAFIAVLVYQSGKQQHKRVITKRDEKLYHEAARLIDRLLNISSLSAGIPEDILSPDTRKQMEIWLAQYRKELDK
jgi:hypothetical protein